MFEIATEKDMEKALEIMTPDQRDHLKLVISELVRCYVNEDVHGLLLIGKSEHTVASPMKIMSINATDMEAATLMATASEFINYSVMEDAPPKEHFN